jgi:hypothetical protein
MPLNYICSKSLYLCYDMFCILWCSPGKNLQNVKKLELYYDAGKVAYATRCMGGVNVQTHIFLTSALVRSEWSALWPGVFTPGKRAHCILKLGGWVGRRAGLVDTEKWQFLTLPGLKLLHLGHPASRCTECTIPALLYRYCVTIFVFLLVIKTGAQKCMLCIRLLFIP